MKMSIPMMHGELVSALEAAACRAITLADEIVSLSGRDLLLLEAEIIREHVADLKAAEMTAIAEMEAEDAARYHRRY